MIASYVEQIMGMPISVALRGPHERGSERQEAAEAVFADLRAVDARFSTYRPDSELCAIQAGHLPLAEASAEMQAVAALCDEARVVTSGAFEAWLPDANGQPQFDPTGLVKGWAVERAARHLAALGDHDFCLNAAGDVIVGCSRVDTPAWRIGIEHPIEPDTILAIVELRVGAVATSGTAARGLHIVDPQTGEAATGGVLSASVGGPSLLWADVYATAAVVQGADAVAFLEAVDGYEGLVFGLEDRSRVTSGWRLPTS